MKLRIAVFVCCFTVATGAVAQASAPTNPMQTPKMSAAQPPMAASPGIPGEAKQAYIRVRDFILKAVDKMPPEDYSFQPTPEVRTFAQVVNHITEAQTRICSGLNGRTKPAPVPGKTKAEVVAALKETFNQCDDAYDSVNESNMAQTVSTGRVQRSKLALLFGNVSHDNEMYGTMSVYMRLKGIVPPSSEPDGSAAPLRPPAK